MPEIEVIISVQAAIAEYLASCSRHAIVVPAGLHLLSVDVALLKGHQHQVRLLSAVIRPQSSSAIC